MTRDRDRAVAEAALAAMAPEVGCVDGVRHHRRPTSHSGVTLDEAVTFACDPGIAQAIGVTVVRSNSVPRGTWLEDRTRGQLSTLIVGTHVEDPLEVVRRDARRWVREGMVRVTPWQLRDQHARQRKAEDLVDQLAGPLEWPSVDPVKEERKHKLAEAVAYSDRALRSVL